MSRSTAEMVRLARDARGLTQGELAEASGVAQGTISKVENELIELDADRMAKLATALGYPPALFNADPDTQAVLALFNRKLKTTPAGQRRTAEARVNLARLHLSRLLKGVQLESRLTFPTLELDELDGDVEEAASLVRQRWRLPMGPIKDLTATVEAAGGIVSVLDFGTLKIDAASQWPHERPFFFLRPGLTGDRWRLNLAHEVGHMVLHAVPSPELELEANRFAGALLMPADEIRSHFPRQLNLGTLLEMKLHWKVSMQALVMRGSELGAITDRQKRSFFQMVNARNLRTREPGRVPVETPSLLQQVVTTHLQDMGYSLDDLSAVALLEPDDLRVQFNLAAPETHSLRLVE